MKQPIRVAVTGAAGQIGYALLFRIASGQMFGPDQPVILQLIELPFEKAMNSLNGVAMDVVALRLGTNRNAIYKNLFDARRTLRAKLAAAGYPVGDDARRVPPVRAARRASLTT